MSVVDKPAEQREACLRHCHGEERRVLKDDKVMRFISVERVTECCVNIQSCLWVQNYKIILITVQSAPFF